MDNDGASISSGDPDTNGGSAVTTACFEKVVGLTYCSLPGTTSISANFQFTDCLIGVDDLHAEPVWRNAFFVVQY